MVVAEGALHRRNRFIMGEPQPCKQSSCDVSGLLSQRLWMAPVADWALPASLCMQWRRGIPACNTDAEHTAQQHCLWWRLRVSMWVICSVRLCGSWASAHVVKIRQSCAIADTCAIHPLIAVCALALGIGVTLVPAVSYGNVA